MNFWSLNFIAGLIVLRTVGARQAPAFYHRSIDKEFRRLGTDGNCPSARVTITDSPLLRLRIKGAGAESPGAKRVVFAFGEHARELLSPESALHFARLLCGSGGAAPSNFSSGDVSNARDLLASGLEFDILPNLNPDVREKVIGGEFCLREDGQGVDINRNYGGAAHWSGHQDEGFAAGETNPGPTPFSEVATQMVRRVLTSSSSAPTPPPGLFVAVHTGEFAMFNAPAWTDSDDPLFTSHGQKVSATNPAEAVHRISSLLTGLQPRHCPECAVGALGQNEGFTLRGTSLDYAAGLGIPATLLEIYTGSDEMKGFQELEQTMADLHWKHQQGHSPTMGASFLQREQQRSTPKLPQLSPVSEAESCFRQFNPEAFQEFDAVLKRWSSVYLDLAKAVFSAE